MASYSHASKAGLSVEFELPELAEVERRSGCLVDEMVLLRAWTMDGIEERREKVEGGYAAGQRDDVSSSSLRKKGEQSAFVHGFTMSISTEALESPTS